MPDLVRTLLSAAAVTVLIGHADAVRAADTYPSRPVELIVPWGPGGGADQLARKIAQLWEPALGTSLPVINVPGAAGQTGLTKMLTADADGYTVSVLTADTLALTLSPEATWRRTDVALLGVLIQQNSGFFVASDSPFDSWDDVVEAAKTRNLRVAITGFGSADDVSVNFFKSQGLNLTSVPFAKPGERYSAVIGGNAELLFEQAGDIRSFLESGQLKPLLFLTDRPEPAFPDVPTAKDLGFDLRLPQYRTIVVRAGTSLDRLSKLRETLAKAASTPEFKAYLEEQYASPDSVIIGEPAERFVDDSLEEWKRSAGT